MAKLIEAFGIIEGLLWHDYVLYTILIVGVLFTIWSGFGQFRALTHGVQVVRGKFDHADDPGAINHFQALSAALSATVGLGNIGGVALAISLGGPGAVFWMWIVGFFGMAIKMTEVSMAMLYRNTDDRENPEGGPMWVAEKGFRELFPGLARFGVFLAGIFVVTLLISTATGGNMYQAWNVAEITHSYFHIDKIVTGVILAVVVGAVIIGGIKRIGNVAGKIVPVMCGMYFVAAVVVIFMNIGQVPALLSMIVSYAFSPGDAAGAFVGGTAGYAFLWGMKRALFSNEAGQGSAPIAHSAARTDEPVREGVVAGLEPFIDTIVVCTLTALVILSSGIWNRTDGEAHLPAGTVMVESEGGWKPSEVVLPARVDESPWNTGEKVFVIAEVPANPENANVPMNADSGNNLVRVGGEVIEDENSVQKVKWEAVKSPHGAPLIQVFDENGVSRAASSEDVVMLFDDYQGATLTAQAFDRGTGMPLGMYLVTVAAWLFAISTMISWSYYGEQGVAYLVGRKFVMLYKIIFCALIVVACTPLLPNDKAVGTLTGFGTGVMLFANIPIMLIFGAVTMKRYHEYMGKLKRGEFHEHAARSIHDLTDGD
ncbi:MAG: sodium:alanine symporter family protein [Phycisphaeraceae bacterium]|nr:sodium:alanine symporter family protein [Phycisphaerales bacterium]MCB9858989.1 sodium:alanine symporter family protein [Phycisphaeraceae bacterium]